MFGKFGYFEEASLTESRGSVDLGHRTGCTDHLFICPYLDNLLLFLYNDTIRNDILIINHGGFHETKKLVRRGG